MRSVRRGFLVDLTTSEGRLDRFTAICQLMPRKGGVTVDKLAPAVTQQLGLTNIKVIRRHLRTMESIGLVRGEDAGYVVASEGRSLRELVPPHLATRRQLKTVERIFYLRALSCYVPDQIGAMLRALMEKPGEPREYAIAQYGLDVIAAGMPWKNKGVLRSQLQNRPATPPRKVRNNFECFHSWLKQLWLVQDRSAVLTSMGAGLAHVAAEGSDIPQEKIYGTASEYVCGESRCAEYDHGTDARLLVDLLREAYGLFERPELRVADARSVALHVCIRLLVEHRRTLDDERFERVLRTLVSEEVVGAVMTGRDGRVAYISLGLGANP
jgi:hypothetical protein